MSKKILFISHEASRTGAPIILLNMAKTLLEHSDIKVEFLLKKGGSLKQDFEQLGKTYLFYKQKPTLAERALKKATKKDSFVQHNISNLDWSNYDFILSNTITNGDIFPLIRKYYKGKIITYVHELEMATHFCTTEADLANVVKETDLFFTVNNAVKDYLHNSLKVPDKIDIFPYYSVGATIVKSNLANFKKKNADHIFTVGSSGLIQWRKGPEFFIQAAYSFKKAYPHLPIKFIWKGGSKKSFENYKLEFDIKKAGLENIVLIQDAGNDMDAFYNQIDLFLLTSREDPYPLVVLEAADYAVPTICFENTGGIPEFVEGDAGFAVPYMDIDVLVEKIFYFYSNKDELMRFGENAKQKVQSQSYSKPAFIKQISKYFPA